MRIGIVAPSPKPFVAGGAERLWRGLRDHINHETAHQCEIVKLPVGERSFWELLDGYRGFSELDLSGFDLIISGKYPAWIVEHPNHVVYMLHPCRGLYEGYLGPVLQLSDAHTPTEIAALMQLVDRRRGDRSSLPELFDLLDRIRLDADRAALVPWPGPIARSVIRFLDTIALHPSKIRKYAAISRQLVDRPDYFPHGVDVEVLFPPSPLAPRSAAPERYVFTASRLADYKRTDLLVQAMQHVRSDARLLVAGTGPEYGRLRDLAGDDARIELLGYRSDAELEELYSRALAVAFVPYQEDYGLVAVEGMKAGRPIITSQDSGGPTELIRDRENGLVVEAEPQALAGAIDFLASNPDAVERMGRKAHERAASITWDSVLSGLLSAAPQNRPAALPAWGSRGLPRLVVVTTFPVFPPRHGGQARVFQLYRHLARWYDITIVSTVPAGQRPAEQDIAPGLRELRVPKSWEHQEQEDKLREQLRVPIDDISVLAFWEGSPRIVETLRCACEGAAVVVACHPFSYPLIRSVTRIPLWYEAQDVEAQIKREILPKSDEAASWIERVRVAEAESCEEAEFILTCSAEDSRTLQQLYGAPSDKFVVAANGTDLNTIRFASPAAREQLKRKLFGAYDLSPMILFMGSGHQPNLEAAQQVFQLASQLSEYVFPMMGSCCSAFSPSMKPTNVLFLGELSESERLVALEIADIAVNPMLSGSGTNLKMIDFLAAGLPTITTPTGARGLHLVDDEHCLIRDIRDFAKALKQLIADPPLQCRLAHAGRKFAEERYGWAGIAAEVYAKCGAARNAGRISPEGAAAVAAAKD